MLPDMLNGLTHFYTFSRASGHAFCEPLNSTRNDQMLEIPDFPCKLENVRLLHQTVSIRYNTLRRTFRFAQGPAQCLDGRNQ